jgi:Protein of unknown function (DUF3102)
MTKSKQKQSKSAKRGRFDPTRSESTQAIRPYVAETKQLPAGLEQLRDRFNELHREAQFLVGHVVIRAIRGGELLTELKKLVGHGHWRVWVAKNLECSIRTASRYMWCFRHADELQGVKTIGEAMKQIRTEKGTDAIGADYKKIRKDLVGGARVLRELVSKLSYEGDSPEIIEEILNDLREEIEGLREDLGEF